LKADLHLHTTASDGRLKPGEMVSLAVKAGLDVIAITDHDSIEGVAPAIAASHAYPSLTVIPGIELSTDVPHGEVHMLGYFIDYNDIDLAARLEGLRDSRKARATRMIAKLNDLGMKIEWQRVQELAQDGSMGRPHIAQALLEAGYVGSVREAFDKYISRNGPAYAEREKMTPVESVKMITDARGLPVLAHPANIDDLDKLMPDLVKAGLVGIEVFYTKYTPETISVLLTISNHYNLITTGGTDYHNFGDGLEDIIGTVLAPPDSVKQLFLLADKRNLELTN
jgi:predicted metal-dependent phosphoesterase TrpH